MRVLLLIDSLTAGGKERRLLELIKGFKSYNDIELHLVIFSDKIHFKEVFDYGIPVSVLKRVPKKNPAVFYRFYKLCKSWKPELIHSWGTMSTIISIPTSIFLGIDIINGNIANAPDGMGFFDSRLLQARITFPFSKAIVSNSKAGLKVYGVPLKKGVCIYNGFDANRTRNLVDKVVIKNRFKIETEKVIGMVGNFRGTKDYNTFINAAQLVIDSVEDVSFIAVGGGSELSKYKELLPKEIASKFIFTDMQRDVESIVNIFDIGVLSTYTEGISNAILEYMAFSIPTVASIGGATPETVEDQMTGFLVPRESPELMAEKLIYLLENPMLISKMGKAGKKRLEQVFSLDKMTSSFCALYKKVTTNE